MINKLKNHLKELCKITAMPSHEKAVKEYILSHCKGLKTQLSNLGNLLVYFDGEDNMKKPLLVDAHMDEVGFFVRYIEKNGFIRISNYGGIDARILAGQRLTVHAKDGKIYTGLTGVLPPHVTGLKDLKIIEIEDHILDCGFNSEAEVLAKNIRPGCQISFKHEFEELENNLFCSKAIDDRAGCAVLLCLIDELKNKKTKKPLVLSFSVQEEGGLRGAISVSNIVKPDLALIIEATTACDVQGIANDKKVTELNKGCAFTVVDNYINIDPELLDIQIELAKKNNIKFQFKTPKPGGTNAGNIHMHGEGVKSCICALPTRYLHSPVSLASWSDLEEVYKFAKVFIYNF